MQTRQRWALWGLVVLAGAGYVLCLTGTRIGVSPDSVHYLYAAQSFAQGKGFLTMDDGGRPVPLTHYPPLLPGTLSPAFLAGIDPLLYAKIANLIYYATTVLLLMSCVYSQTRSAAASVAAGIIGATSWPLVFVNMLIWSEAPFIAIVMLWIACTARYVRAGEIRILAASGGLAFLAFFCRNAGLFLIPCGLLLVLLRRERLGRRARHVLVFGASAGVPILLWLVRNSLDGGQAAGRSFAAQGADFWLIAWRLICTSTILPVPGRSVLLSRVALGVVVLVIACGCARAFQRARQARRPVFQQAPMLWTMLCALLMYMALMVAWTSADATAIWDARILAPAYVILVGLLVICAALLLEAWRAFRPVRALAAGALVCVAAVQAYNTAVLTIHGSYVYEDDSWRGSKTLKAVRDIPPGMRIYTNAQDAILYSLGRTTMYLPKKYETTTLAPNREYSEALSAIGSEVRRGAAVIVYFDQCTYRPYLPSREDLQMRIPCEAKALEDGAILCAEGSDIASGPPPGSP